MATGQYVHRTGCWDNGHPWHGEPRGWMHALRDAGYHTASIGKNHYRSTADDNGFVEERLPMHVRNGIGDLYGMLRQEAATYPGTDAGAGDGGAAAAGAGAGGYGGNIVRGPAIMAETAGAGESNHTEYDRAITQEACDWLSDRGGHRAPWALVVSFVAPHFPLIAPPDFFNLYPFDRLSAPRQYAKSERPTHPVVQAMARVWNFDDYFDAETLLRAQAGYLGLVSFLDHNIGAVLAALDRAGLSRDTCVVYTSDHGEMLGNKGLWSTSALYEESVGVPLMLSGAGVKSAMTVDTPVSHVDLAPTLLQVAGIAEPLSSHAPGGSLLNLTVQPERQVLSEYHAGGSITGCFMLRAGRWKYHYYVDAPPELFDLAEDPGETRDLGQDEAHREVRAACDAALRRIVDPEEANRRAFADQHATMERHGGAEAVRRRGHPGEHALDRRLGVE